MLSNGMTSITYDTVQLISYLLSLSGMALMTTIVLRVKVFPMITF